jgi:tetratricopeptide (TPR) repeat protein
VAQAAAWPAGQAVALNLLGIIELRTGQLSRAADRFGRVLTVCPPDDAVTPNVARLNLATTEYDRGNLNAAVNLYREANGSSHPHPAGLIETMGCALLGRALLAVGRTAEARQHLDRAVRAAQALDAPWHESLALCWLTQVDRDTGLSRALSRAHGALGLNSTDPSQHRADTLVLVGTIHRRLGQPA